eukprot:766612-Hanusia_phi.AAC.6
MTVILLGAGKVPYRERYPTVPRVPGHRRTPSDTQWDRGYPVTSLASGSRKLMFARGPVLVCPRSGTMISNGPRPGPAGTGRNPHPPAPPPLGSSSPTKFTLHTPTPLYRL